MTELPCSKESEMMVLGCMLSDDSALCMGTQTLDECDFCFPAHKPIFQALCTIFYEGKPAGTYGVSEELRRVNKLDDVGGVNFVVDLSHFAGASVDIQHYITELKSKALARKHIHLFHEGIVAFSKGSADPVKLSESFSQRFLELGKAPTTSDPCSIDEILSGEKSRENRESIVQSLEKRQNFFKEHKKPFIAGIPTGFDDLDSQVTLLQDSNLVILAARPAMGKTALALNIADHVCTNQKLPVAIFSLEMGGNQLAERLLSMRSRVAGESMRRGAFTDAQYKKIKEEEARLRESKMFIYDQNCSSVSQVVSRARRLKDKEGIRLLVIDYLQLLGTDARGDSRQYEVAEISRRLKLLAIELKIPILCVAQLSRKVEERTDKKPLMSDLRDSGQLEQDADAVMFIYREGYYEQRAGKEKDVANVFLGKNRHGPIPAISLLFDSNCGRFSSLRA